MAAPRAPWTSNRVIGSPNPPPPFVVERIHPQINFNNPIDLAFMPGSDRLFVVDQSGKVWSFDTRSNAAKPGLVLDLRQHHQPFDNILGFTFHPGFVTNRFVFINYNEPGGRSNGAHVSRFTVSTNEPPVIDPASERVIIRWLSGGHNGCALAFGNDGFLYISAGDADDPDPPDGKRKTGQDLSDLLANILRLDVDHDDGAKAYSIPRDNPFLTTPGARPEVWAFGLRNPFRMSFDHATGDLWVGDVGWETWEMIYRVRRGGNYGWPLTEGPNPRVRTDVKPGPGPILPPLFALPHSDAASITGGRVYHGMKLAKLRGAYICGDWETGKFWALRNEGDKVLSHEELCDTTLQPISFAEDRDGELLILDYHGGLYALTPNVAAPANLAFPRRLSETGVFSDIATLAPAPGIVSFRPAAGMWSDHATVERLLGVPGADSIATADGRQTIAGRMWYFPSNTVFARTLTLELEPGQPATRRRVETQLFHFDGQTWNGYTFRWNPAQSDADLVPAGGTNDSFTMIDATAPGGRREVPWRFASRAECLRCHNSWAGDTLSFNWLQLDSKELARLDDLGVLRVQNRPGGRDRRTLADPHDPSRDLADRARSWLHVNCAGCHRSGAGGVVASHFNYDKPTAEWRALDEKPTRGDFDLLAARIIAPGDPYRSTLFYRITTEGSGHMPHTGSRLADERGIALVRDWIQSLPPENTDPAATRLASDIAAALQRKDTARLLTTMNGALALASELPASAPAAHTNALVRDLFQRFLPPGQRRQTLGADIHPPSLLALRGDATRGRELFAGVSQCARCHSCAGVGRAFGPDLGGIGKKYDRDQLLDHILNPSKLIAPEYQSVTLTLRDDTELTGFILKRTGREILLRGETLTESAVKLADVKETRESTLSAMPEGLLAPLTAQEAADLLEFLGQSKPATGH